VKILFEGRGLSSSLVEPEEARKRTLLRSGVDAQRGATLSSEEWILGRCRGVDLL